MKTHIFMLFLILALHLQLSESIPVSSTYQVLPPRPGYVPVYIRKGDTPLEEINLELAEAFKALEERTKIKENQLKNIDYLLSKNTDKNEIIRRNVQAVVE